MQEAATSGDEARVQDVLSSARHREWDSQTWFLCGLVGICQRVSCKASLDTEGIPSEPTVLDDFFSACLSLISNDCKLVREMIKVNIGNYLNSDLIFVLCTHLNSSPFLADDGRKITATTVFFAEETIGIVKFLVLGLREPLDERTCSGIQKLILSIMVLVSSQPETSPNGVYLKKKLTGLVEVMVNRREMMGTYLHHHVESNFLRHIIDWASRGKLDAGLESACLQSISRLLEVIPLQSLEDTRTAMFLRYFNFLAGALTRLLQSIAPGNGTPSSARLQEVQRIEKVVVKGLARLLQMNVEVGLDIVERYCLHENPRLRQCFLKVFLIF